MKHQLAAFIDDLRSTHRGNLVSVILYGSAAAGDHTANRSDYNILVALKTIGPGDLRNAHAAVREWLRLGHSVPVFFTVAELQDAGDVFPIEFSAMQRVRKVLYGSDVLAGLEFSDANLRHQVEYELRSKLIGLRRAYIPASGTVEGLTGLMAESIANFAVLFGAVLMLKGVDVPTGKREIIALLAEQMGINGSPFEKVLNIRENNFSGRLDEVTSNQLFTEYLEEIEKVIEGVDKMGA